MFIVNPFLSEFHVDFLMQLRHMSGSVKERNKMKGDWDWAPELQI